MTITISWRRLTGMAAAIIALVTLLALTACEPKKTSTAQRSGQKQTEDAFAQQSAAVPYPVNQLKDSLERRNVRERLLRYNNPTKISYIYLLADTGRIYAYFTIKGKVSSNQSQLTTTDLIAYGCDDGLDGCQAVTVPAPGDDGSYGPNEDGVFFFSTDGVLITWNGKYLLADAPLKIDEAKLVLNYMPGSKPTK